MSRIAQLRKEAMSLRHLATSIANPAIRRGLIKLADDYEAMAAQVESAANDDSAGGAPADLQA